MCLDGRDRQPSHDTLLDGLTNAHLHASASFKLLLGKEARKQLPEILGIPKILGSSLFESQIFSFKLLDLGVPNLKPSSAKNYRFGSDFL